jgi:ABC-2 type transport system ATP-binding protein
VNELVQGNNIIKIEHITFHYDKDKQHGVGPITFEIQKGSIVGLLGPNGAGKTTTVGLICCLLYPQHGAAKINGFDIRTERQKVRQQIGLMTQGRSLEWRLTIQENIDFYLRLHRALVPSSLGITRTRKLESQSL